MIKHNTYSTRSNKTPTQHNRTQHLFNTIEHNTYSTRSNTTPI